MANQVRHPLGSRSEKNPRPCRRATAAGSLSRRLPPGNSAEREMPERVRACSSRAAKGKRGCIPHRNEFRFALSGINPNSFGFAPRAPLAPVALLGEPLRCGGSPGVAVSRRATAGKCTPRCSKWRETPRRSSRSTRNLRPGERQPHWTADPAGTEFQRGHFPAVERRETAPRKESGSAFRTHRELSV